jgi:hypothetical protein
MSKQNKITNCEHCGAEIAKSAKTCPHCGGKNNKPFHKKLWFKALVAIVILGAIGSLGGNKNNREIQNNDTLTVSSDSSSNEQKKSDDTAKVKAKNETPKISYKSYTVSELMKDLKSNALKASDKYRDQYVKLTGKLNVIDSSGKYISITPADEDFAIIGVHCNIKSDEQKKAIMDMSVGDTMTVKGKITEVGEVLGYYLDIDEVVQSAK